MDPPDSPTLSFDNFSNTSTPFPTLLIEISLVSGPGSFWLVSGIRCLDIHCGLTFPRMAASSCAAARPSVFFVLWPLLLFSFPWFLDPFLCRKHSESWLCAPHVALIFVPPLSGFDKFDQILNYTIALIPITSWLQDLNVFSAISSSNESFFQIKRCHFQHNHKFQFLVCRVTADNIDIHPHLSTRTWKFTRSYFWSQK